MHRKHACLTCLAAALTASAASAEPVLPATAPVPTLERPVGLPDTAAIPAPRPNPVRARHTSGKLA